LLISVQELFSLAPLGPVETLTPIAVVFNVTGLTLNIPDAQINVFC